MYCGNDWMQIAFNTSGNSIDHYDIYIKCVYIMVYGAVRVRVQYIFSISFYPSYIVYVYV